MKHLAIVALTCVIASGVSARTMALQQSTPPAQSPKPEPKPDPKNIAGKWDVTVESDQGAMQVALDMKLDGKKVTGTITSPQGTSPVEGEYADGKLNFSLSFDSPNGTVQVSFAGTMKDDGSLAGTLDFGQGQIPWHAVRSKG